MSAVKIIDALSIPSDARIDQRISKKLLLEQDIPTSADRRQIHESIEDMLWVAALKPTNIGVPAFRDNFREYLEIAVLTLTLRPTAKLPRLTELIHRIIPYPVVLVALHDGSVIISLAHTRWSQGENGKVVIEEIRQTRPFHPESPTEVELSFLTSLKISNLPRTNLFALYQGWLDCIAMLEAAKITGKFSATKSAYSKDLWNSLDDYNRLFHDITILRAQAEKEKQLNRRVELNLKIKQLEAELTHTRKTL